MVSDRLLAAMAGAKLDRQLADGVPPDATPALARRARRLVAPTAREQLGRGLRRIVADAHERALPGPRVPLYRKQVLEAEDELRLLASRLQSPNALSPQGVAKVRLFLTDGCGPLFGSPNAADLMDAIRDAIAALS
jgi:hypothetical protein